eukprot:SAG11_NODE_9229_length_931_cov_0.868990_1_plen_26_part_10
MGDLPVGPSIEALRMLIVLFLRHRAS